MYTYERATRMQELASLALCYRLICQHYTAGLEEVVDKSRHGLNVNDPVFADVRRYFDTVLETDPDNSAVRNHYDYNKMLLIVKDETEAGDEVDWVRMGLAALAFVGWSMVVLLWLLG